MASDWKSRRVLVTGAGGFIGSHLTEELVRRGARVRCLVHYNGRNDWGHLEGLPGEVKNKLDVVLGDIQDAGLMQKTVENCDTVFHLASLIAIPYSYVAPQSYVTTNIYGTLNLLEAARKADVQTFIHTSTSETYGTAMYTPIDERHPLQGQSPYAATKIGADKLAESYFRSFDLPVLTLRPFNTFGPRQSARAVIPTIIAQALKGDDVHLGAVDPVRDLTFVKDTVAAFIRAAEVNGIAGEVINVGQGYGIRIDELVEKIGAVMGKKLTIHSDSTRYRPAKSEVMKLICDATKAHELLGWKPEWTLEAGLSATVEAIKSAIGAYKEGQFVL